MPAIACLNGAFSAPEVTRVPIDDRGFLFGDGVYEAMRCYGGRVWALERHLLRLDRSLAAIAIPSECAAPLRDWIQEAMERSQLAEAIVYVQITRGSAPRQHTFTPELSPNVLITVRPTAPVSAVVRAAGAVAICVPDQRWARRDIKSINLLPNVLAKQQAYDAGAFEAIFVEPDGRVTEGSSTNVFAILDGRICTHPADHYILGGITRDLVLGLARRLEMEIREEPFQVEALRAADEVFLSGTTTEVLGVTRLDGAPMGSGSVGPLTRRLQTAFEECVRGKCDGVMG